MAEFRIFRHKRFVSESSRHRLDAALSFRAFEKNIDAGGIRNQDVLVIYLDADDRDARLVLGEAEICDLVDELRLRNIDCMGVRHDI